MLSKLVNNDISYNDYIYSLLIIVLGLSSPLILFPIINFFNYSIIIEELLKAIIVFFLISKIKYKIKYLIIFAFLFGLSETIFYINNIVAIGDYNLFIYRFLFTIPMHIFTMLTIYSFYKIKKVYIILGFIFAIIIHYLFNDIILTLNFI